MRRPHALVIPLLAAAAACAGSRPAERAGSTPPVSVALVTVVEQPVAEVFEAGGVIRPRLTATISSRIVAPVVRVLVRPGDRVRAGQTLVALDDRQIDADALRAAAALEGARQAAAGATADKAAADATFRLARTTHERIAGLAASRSATTQELDQAATAMRSAEARLAAADARSQEAEAAVTAAAEGHESVRIARTYATLTAPFDGVVSTRSIDPGALAGPGTPLVTVEADDAFRLETTVDESRASFITVGSPIDVVVDQCGALPLRGRVDEIARAFDAASHNVTVKILLPRADGLRSGMFGRARIAGPAAPALVIPPSALVTRGQLTFVYVADHDIARLRLVRVAPGAGERVAVTAGLSAGESVVRTPPPSLTDGQPLSRAGR